jgi:hydrogenase nickel insertion protein HypA
VHEYSIVQAILHRVQETARQRGATSVSSVTVRIGEAAGVEVDLLRTAWDIFRAAGGLGEPELRVLGMSVAWECATCGDPIAAGGPLRCPLCGYTARLVSGDEILLERVELELPEPGPGPVAERASPYLRGEHV